MTNTSNPAPTMPGDLSRYLGRKTVVKLILDAVHSVIGDSVDYQWFASDGKTFQRPMMLTLLTYCYATGVYGSAEIELNIERDRMTHYLCAWTYPDIDVIRGFRRLNRREILQCLVLVLRRAWELRFSEDEPSPAGDACGRRLLNRWFRSEVAPDFTADAEQRIAEAIRADSMTLDD
jgi:transposase